MDKTITLHMRSATLSPAGTSSLFTFRKIEMFDVAPYWTIVGIALILKPDEFRQILQKIIFSLFGWTKYFFRLEFDSQRKNCVIFFVT